MKPCPFKVGETVAYRPSSRAKALGVMTDLAKLESGQIYKVARIDKGAYVVLEGFENSTPGGLYWTEFTKHEATPTA